MTVETNAWVSLEDTKTFLGITGTSKDTLLTLLINEGYKALEDYLGVKIITREHTEYHDGDGSGSVLVDNFPITAIDSIYDDPNLDYNADRIIFLRVFHSAVDNHFIILPVCNFLGVLPAVFI